MNKKIIAAVLTAALTLSFASLTGCNTAETNSLSENGSSVSSAEPTSESTQALEKTSFNLGHLNSTAHVLGFVAKEEGYFEEEGLDVNLTLFSSAAELSTGLESDKLDVAFIGSVPSITFQSQGHDLTIFGGAMTNGHGYVIKPEYVKDIDKWDVSILKGRNVASVKNSVQDAELQILLKDKGIEIGEGDDKVNIVYFDSQRMHTMHFKMIRLMLYRHIPHILLLPKVRVTRLFIAAAKSLCSKISLAAVRLPLRRH